MVFLFRRLKFFALQKQYFEVSQGPIYHGLLNPYFNKALTAIYLKMKFYVNISQRNKYVQVFIDFCSYKIINIPMGGKRKM